MGNLGERLVPGDGSRGVLGAGWLGRRYGFLARGSHRGVLVRGGRGFRGLDNWFNALVGKIAG